MKDSSKQILFIRHAQAIASSDDFARELTNRGIQEARNVGLYMAKMGYIPNIIIASPALRTQQTAEIIKKSADLNCDIYSEPSLYNASSKAIYTIVQKAMINNQFICVIGHNSGITTIIDEFKNLEYSPHLMHKAKNFNVTCKLVSIKISEDRNIISDCFYPHQ